MAGEISFKLDVPKPSLDLFLTWKLFEEYEGAFSMSFDNCVYMISFGLDHAEALFYLKEKVNV